YVTSFDTVPRPPCAPLFPYTTLFRSLVDADLRNPSVAKTLGLEGSVGLTTVLLGRASLNDMMVRWGQSEMYVLPAGEIPPNPSEDRKSTRLNSSHVKISYAVFCLKKK